MKKAMDEGILGKDGITLVAVVAVFIVLVFSALVFFWPSEVRNADVLEETPVEQREDVPVEKPAVQEPKVVMTALPGEVDSGGIFRVSWSVEGTTASTSHTGVHFGPFSVPNPTGPGDYPKASVFLCTDKQCSLPQSFSVDIGILEPGEYYLRAHAIIGGKNVWSEERKLVVRETASEEAAGEPTETTPTNSSTVY
ncbi:hypothetical protein HYU11_02895 [Candidatus Woesearchaeota archaeon]|nr:hypothetical protein [Candidatus Woesearchaeota archaeon]